MHDGVMKSARAKIAIVVSVGVFGLIGAGCDSSATTSGPTTLATFVPSADNDFCFPAAKLVGTYSVNVEWALGLNDNRSLPNHMTPGISAAVRALADRSLALSSRSPTAHLKSELRLLSVELEESVRPIDVVRAEATFGATGYSELAQLCPSAMMIMTSTNPLGGFNPD
jgi:hypothetical protein